MRTESAATRGTPNLCHTGHRRTPAPARQIPHVLRVGHVFHQSRVAGPTDHHAQVPVLSRLRPQVQQDVAEALALRAVAGGGVCHLERGVVPAHGHSAMLQLEVGIRPHEVVGSHHALVHGRHRRACAPADDKPLEGGT